MEENVVSRTITADINEIAGVSEVIESLMQRQGFTAEQILDTQLAVEEALTNIIIHGYGDAGGEIFISCRAGPEAIVIRLEDQAEPFNPLLLPEPDLHGDVEDRKIGGLGIFLIRRIMDDIRYRFLDGKNILELTKRKA